MIYAAILAGGVGSRMGNVEKPKQFLMIGNKPIIIHTIEKFFINSKFEKIIVLTPKTWIQYTNDLVKRHIPDVARIVVIEGGSTRNETINQAINYIEANHGLNDDDIIVTHDSVRPFITHRIIEDNIKFAKLYGACDTVIPSSDTIVESNDGEVISTIPNRKLMYLGQTPQSFNIKQLQLLSNSLTDNEKAILTDAAKIFVLKGQKVYLVNGEVFNIKVTYPYDIKIANTILKGDIR